MKYCSNFELLKDILLLVLIENLIEDWTQDVERLILFYVKLNQYPRFEPNRPILQIPECICAISQNVPFCNRNVHMCVHISVTKWCIMGYVWCIVGFVKWVYWQASLDGPLKNAGLIHLIHCALYCYHMIFHDFLLFFCYRWVATLGMFPNSVQVRW